MINRSRRYTYSTVFHPDAHEKPGLFERGERWKIKVWPHIKATHLTRFKFSDERIIRCCRNLDDIRRHLLSALTQGLDTHHYGLRGYHACGVKAGSFWIEAESPVARMLNSPRLITIASALASAVSQAIAP